MRLTRMTIRKGSHPAFGRDIELELDERVNLFIGPNGCGKTSLLRVLAGAGPLDNGTLIPFNLPTISISEDWKSRFEHPNDADAILLENFSAFGEDGRLLGVPWAYIPATRIALPGEFDNEAIPFDGDSLVTNGLSGKSLDIQWPDNSQVFNNQWVETLVKRLFDHLKAGGTEFGQLLHLLRVAYRCAKTICGEVIIGSPGNYVSDPSDIFAPDEIDPLAVEPYVHPGMGVTTVESQNGGAIFEYAGNLSSGTQGPYMWVLYLALKLANHYKWSKGWENEATILLIDEIENHLHPTWQRRVIPVLVEHFPGLQIFATTHSPFVVAGREIGQVHLLKRDEEGRVTATTNTEDVIGWTADEILRNMMGVDDPTDDVTAAAARELRELRNSTPENSEEAEAERQLRMQELRQLVNRDLLAGGPMAAQRELFEQHFSEALEEYRRSQSLNQESG